MGMQDGEPIHHPWVNKAIERAQKRVEERNFEIRKHLLEYDDVLNEQRNFIYARRDEILDDEELKTRVMRTVEEIISDLFEEHTQERRSDYTVLLNYLYEEFFYSPGFDTENVHELPPHELRALIMDDLGRSLEEKQQNLGKPSFNAFIRYEYLKNIDARWQDHLENLEALREAVYLRAYAQKNPLLEYKLEGFQIFDQLLMDIRTSIARKVLKVQIESFEGRNLILERERVGDARHRVLGQFAISPGAAAKARAGAQAVSGSSGASGGASGGERREASPAQVQVKRSVPKVGRNDPCPCGSGKKYKYCHGR